MQVHNKMPTHEKAAKYATFDDARIGFEREYLTGLLRSVGGNVSAAARIAGVDRTTLYRIAERAGVRFDRERRLAAA